MKNLRTKKSLVPDGFIGEFNQIFTNISSSQTQLIALTRNSSLNISGKSGYHCLIQEFLLILWDFVYRPSCHLAKIVSYTFPTYIPFISFSCLTALARTSNIMLTP